MRSLFGELRERIAGKGVKIVFPEGNDDRVVRAAARLKFEGLVDPIILGDPAEVHKILSDLGFADFNYTIINPETYEGFEEMKEKFLEIRKGKATVEDAEKLLRDVNSGYGTSCPSNYQNKTRHFTYIRCFPYEP